MVTHYAKGEKILCYKSNQVIRVCSVTQDLVSTQDIYVVLEIRIRLPSIILNVMEDITV